MLDPLLHRTLKLVNIQYDSNAISTRLHQLKQIDDLANQLHKASYFSRCKSLTCNEKKPIFGIGGTSGGQKFWQILKQNSRIYIRK